MPSSARGEHVQVSEIPGWLREYMIGASQELYELAAFPRVLHGQSYRTAAGFIFDSCHAVLLAVEGTAGVDRGKLSIASMEQVGAQAFLIHVMHLVWA
jgi:hypothetical protein